MSLEYEPQAGAEVNIKDYLDVLRRRKALFVQVFVLVVVAGIAVTAMSKPEYQAQAALYVGDRRRLIPIFTAGSVLDSVGDMWEPEPLATQLQELRTGPLIPQAIKEATRERPGAKPPVVDVQASPDTNVISVQVIGPDPKETADLANEVIKLKLVELQGRDTDGLKRALEIVEESLKKQKGTVESLEKELTALERQDPRAAAEARKDALDMRRQMTGNDLEAKEKLAAATQQLASIQAALANAERNRIVRRTRPVLNREYEEARGELHDLQQQRALLLRTLTPIAPEVQDLDAMIAEKKTAMAALKPTVPEEITEENPNLERLQKNLELAQERLASARAEATVAAVALSNAPPVPGVPVGAEDRLKQVTLEQVSARRTLEDLEKQKRDISLRKTQQEQNTRHRQMQVAQTPMAASSSRSAATLIISVMLALVLATLLTFAQEVLDDRINKPDDLERITQLPALAHVPTIPQDQPRLLNALAPNSHVAEAYRGLRSSIYFAAIDSPVRRIMVTSASKGEGKSITSVNLATVMAMEGKRVILVDADLRKPSIHRLLEVPNDHGLSEVLAGLVDIKDVIQETGIVNLRTVCAGPIPPNPAEALSSSAFDRVVDYLEEIADVVIYDTTPCTPVTDPLVIARQMDGVILVVYMGQTRKGSVKQALELLGRSRARLLGLVYNRARHPGNGYYGYGYYGYYGYGTYGNEDRPRNSRNASVAAGSRDRKALGSEGPRGSAAAPRRRVDS